MTADDPLTYLTLRLREALFKRAGHSAARSARSRRSALRRMFAHRNLTDGRERPPVQEVCPAGTRFAAQPEYRHPHRRLEDHHRQQCGRSRLFALLGARASGTSSSVSTFRCAGWRLPSIARSCLSEPARQPSVVRSKPRVLVRPLAANGSGPCAEAPTSLPAHSVLKCADPCAWIEEKFGSLGLLSLAYQGN